MVNEWKDAQGNAFATLGEALKSGTLLSSVCLVSRRALKRNKQFPMKVDNSFIVVKQINELYFECLINDRETILHQDDIIDYCDSHPQRLSISFATKDKKTSMI